MSMTAFLGAIELGLCYALLAFGIYVTFRILYITDLTGDGSFVLGAAVSAMLTVAGHPLLGVAAGTLAGALAGCITALMQTKLGIQPILAGILTMTGLYTINLAVMGGKSNVPLLNQRTIFTPLEEMIGGQYYKILLLAVLVGVMFLVLNLFFRTQTGLSIRATGDNEAMVRASSIDTDRAKLVGFALANGIIALSGAVLAQMQQSADINMGSGMIVIALASLIIGDVFIHGRGVLTGLLAAIVGALLYRLLIALILTTSLPTSYLKLISALVVTVAIAVPTLRRRYGVSRLMRQGGKYAEH